VSWRLARELLCVIVAVVAWGHFIGVVVAVVVNAGVVVDAVILADVTNVTVPSSPHTDVAGPFSAGIKASCEWVLVPQGGARAWANIPLTRWARHQRKGVAPAPLKPRVGRTFRTLPSHRLLPLALASRSPSYFASVVPPLLALPARPRLHCCDVELDTLQRFPRVAPPSRQGGPASSAHSRRGVEGSRR
jgi:hypothetical protein